VDGSGPPESSTGAGASPATAPAATPAKKPGVLFRRIVFGALLLLISCGLLALDYWKQTSYGIGAMVAYSMVFGLRELYRMLEAIAPVLWKRGAQATGFAVVAAQVLQHELASPIQRGFPVAEIAMAAFVLAFLAYQLRFEPSRERLISIVLTLAGVVYILFLGSFVLKVRYLDDVVPVGPGLGYAAVLYLVLAAKGTDMFAFFTGRFLGKRKLIPWISPGKTVAGGVGGLLGAVAITCAFVRFSDLGKVFGWSSVVPFGIIIGLSATAGDLVESLINRSAAVKDSGGLVPEFGGVLDIIDCILFVAPTIYVGALLAHSFS
jgi:phosphatidate cytidylyltransferase